MPFKVSMIRNKWTTQRQPPDAQQTIMDTSTGIMPFFRNRCVRPLRTVICLTIEVPKTSTKGGGHIWIGTSDHPGMVMARRSQALTSLGTSCSQRRWLGGTRLETMASGRLDAMARWWWRPKDCGRLWRMRGGKLLRTQDVCWPEVSPKVEVGAGEHHACLRERLTSAPGPGFVDSS